MRKVERILWILVILVVVAVLSVQGYLYWQIREVEKDIQAKDKQITTLTTRIGELQSKKASIPKLQAFFERLNEKLLLQKEAKQYIDDITGALDTNSIAYSLKVSNVEKVTDKYEIVRLDISFSTDKYSRILSIINTVESQEKWSEISNTPSIKYSGQGYSVSFGITLPYVTDIADNVWDIK